MPEVKKADPGSPYARVLTVPNLISAARLGLVPVFVWLFATRTNDAAALAVLVILGGTDWVDGFVARRTGQVSAVGKVLDPLADRVAVLVVVSALTLRGTISWVLAVAILGRDAIVAIVFPILEARGIPRVPVNRVGKTATGAIYLGVGLAVGSLVGNAGMHAAGTAFLTIGAVLYWIAGVMYVAEIRRRLRDRRVAE